MSKTLKFCLSLVFAIFLLILPRAALAATPPAFPLCVNPQGTVVATYSAGIHGIPGDGKVYEGSDTVYAFNNEQLVQCFCPATGAGIQTNWWKLADIPSEEIDALLKDGWVYVPDGSAWGLENAVYLAKNYTFSCMPWGKGGGDGGTTSSGTTLGATALGIGGGDVLGLASTGNLTQIYGFFVFGLVLIYCATKLQSEE